MKVCIILLCLLAASISFKIEENDSENSLTVFQQEGLGFTNQTGPGCTSEEFNSFITYINQASVYYRSDHLSGLRYIEDLMVAKYGKDSKKYVTFAQSNDSYIKWKIYTQSDEFASTSSKVDKIFPNNSYMFATHADNASHSLTNVAFTNFSTGSGITDAKKQVIHNIILSTEPATYCLCNPAEVITKLEAFDKQNWNAICWERFTLYANVWVKNNQYLYIQPSKCFYVLWAI